MPRKLTHYLRKERRDAALTQADFATLIAAPWKSKISRYERREATPPLGVALAFEAITGKAVAELFAPLYEEVAADVRLRARSLLDRSGSAKNTPFRVKRERSLKRIAAT